MKKSKGVKSIKKIIIITMLAILIVINTGCKEEKIRDVSKNKIPKITNEEIMNIIEKGSNKVGCVFHLGEGIDSCKVNKDPIKIKEEEEGEYYELGSSIDTFDKLYNYLEDIFSEETIKNLVRELCIEEYKGKLYMASCDIVSGYYWSDIIILSIEYNDNIALANLKVEGLIDDEYGEVLLKFIYDEINGWRLHHNEPSQLY
ncbi:DL-endopeptidase inhibitor IseA family protein [Clostridiaceae bacterium M8S5]|nr:DL-endopeptidase inhibitor IseA family protein [Clostridiaceae bacterium M8S5]